MEKYIETDHCGQGHTPSICRTCRTNQAYRDDIRKYFEVPDDLDELCPHGITVEQLDQMPLVPAVKHKFRSRGLGDTLAGLIRWLTFGLIKPCCACRLRQGRLNKWFPYKQH